MDSDAPQQGLLPALHGASLASHKCRTGGPGAAVRLLLIPEGVFPGKAGKSSTLKELPGLEHTPLPVLHQLINVSMPSA